MDDIHFGLKKEIIDKIKSVFSKYGQIESVKLYGSRAKGTFKENSDIDLTLIGDNLDTTSLFRIETELDDLLLPYSIDLSILHQIENKELVDHINRVGLEIYYRAEQSSKN